MTGQDQGCEVRTSNPTSVDRPFLPDRGILVGYSTVPPGCSGVGRGVEVTSGRRFGLGLVPETFTPDKPVCYSRPE